MRTGIVAIESPSMYRRNSASSCHWNGAISSFLDEEMKEVLVYLETNADVPSPRRPRESSAEVEVDLAGSHSHHSRLALGTESPLSDPKKS